MKGFRQLALLLAAGCLLLGAGLIVTGCTEETVLSPSEGTSLASPGGAEIDFIRWNTDSQALRKTYSARTWIKKNKGGLLSMQAKEGNVELKLEFAVSPNSIDDSKEISVAFDDENIDFTFGPSGTTFTPNALMDFVVVGLDLSGVNPKDIKLYYVNPNGEWEVVPTERIAVSIEHGFIAIEGAKIPHFSRYALSKG